MVNRTPDIFTVLHLPSTPDKQPIMFQGLGGAALPSTAGGAPEPSPAEDGATLLDLSTILDKSACYARNENAGFPWGNLFIGDSRLGMRSDADEQLIIHLSFQEFVRVRYLCLVI
jgi:hypothetical protein